ncbi:MAG: 30S ribosomal protein S12 methylthiotransferase RimO [Phycisphaeraceae bacterium]|nr:30S ribosomal protein S12 methylthiotransferase RimO [Phycisphaeraceae bacterium]
MNTTTTTHPDPQAVSEAEDTASVRSVAMVSLGCPKNLVDSEKMMGMLAESGLRLTDESDADAVIINTCGFLEASKEESLHEIREALERKRQGQVKRVIVAGCLVQRHRARILEWCPGVDALIGVFDRDRVTEAVRGLSKPLPGGNDALVELPVYSSIAASAAMARRERQIENDPSSAGYFESDSHRFRLTPRHYAYLRISEGCNQNCAFCTIPSIRGKMRSKPVDRIIEEARQLIADGAVELNLIGQDTTSFGEDIGYGPGLTGMLEALNSAVELELGAGQVWLRLMYAYPSCFTDEMIDAIARLGSVVKYIDMPLQHINDAVLDSMRRRTSRKLIETLLARLRDRVPGIAIRTTFISGYPGETEKQHKELVRFVRDFGFDAMGVFAYSPEPGTPAGSMHQAGKAISPKVAERRRDELMRVQQEVAFARNAELADARPELDVLIDKVEGPTEVEAEDGLMGPHDPDQPWTACIGRSSTQAPQIDGSTIVVTQGQLVPGERVRCRVVAWQDYDLVARPVEELERRMSLSVLKH